ncbi:MAG: DUF4097 family beta strand repeat protein [Phycisphaerales bacterium]|nr:DUF4097 family beta strand repeat protein [Phycisphaerales bacterium]
MVAIRVVMVGLGAGLAAASVGCSYPRVWVESSESFSLPAAGTRWVAVETHNGAVRVAGYDRDDEIVVKVSKKAGGMTDADAGECLAAIDLVNELNGDHRNLGWKWNGARERHWSAVVGFELQVPRSMAADVSTHNGPVTVEGIAGDCRVESHNGDVVVTAKSDNVRAVTHNGAVRVEGPVHVIDVETHNGEMRLALDPAGPVTGRIESHNGSIQLGLGDAAAVDLDCRTENGAVDASLSLEDVSKSRRHLRGKRGQPTGTLRVETHNGSIALK